MPIPQSTSQYLNQVRNSPDAPGSYKYLSDMALYRTLSQRGQIPESNKYGFWEDKPVKPYEPEKTADDELNTMQKWMDLMITEDSHDVFKAGYNRSLTGLVEQAATGKARYNVDDTELSFLEDIGATLVSFFMPLDALSLFVGGGIGKIAAGTTKSQMARGGGLAGKWLKEKFSSDAAKKLAKEGVSLDGIATFNKVERALLGAVGQAPALAVYEGAIGGTQAKINGGDASDIWKGVGYGVLHGAAMGALTGAVGGGMGARAAEIAKSKGIDIGGKQGLNTYDWYRSKIGWGMPGQIVAEGGVFSLSETADIIKSGEDPTLKEFGISWARNMAMFGALKTYGIGKQKGIERVQETKLYKNIKEHADYFSNEVRKAYEKNEASKEENLGKNIKDHLKDETGLDGKEKINLDAINEYLSGKNKESGDVLGVLEIVKEQMGELDRIIKSGDKEAIEGAKGRPVDIFAQLKLAEIMLSKAEKGELTPEQITVNENRRKSIASDRKSLTKLIDDLRGGYEAYSKREKEMAPSTERLKKMNWDKELEAEYINFKEIDPDTGKPWDLSDPKARIYLKNQITREQQRQYNKGKSTETSLEVDKIDDIKIVQNRKSSYNQKVVEHKEQKKKGVAGKSAQEGAVLKIDELMPNKGASDIDKIHKKILLDTFDNKLSAIGKDLSGAAKEGVDFVNWIKKTYKKDITQLNPEQQFESVRRYITETIGEKFRKPGAKAPLDPYVKNIETLKKLGYTEGEIRDAKNAGKTIVDHFREIYADKRINKFTRGEYGERFNMFTDGSHAGKTFNPGAAGKREIVVAKIKDGKHLSYNKSIQEIADYAKKQEEISLTKTKTIKGEELSTAIELARKYRLRPGELTDLAVEQVNPNTGEITLGGKKRERVAADTKIDKPLAKKLFEIAEANGRSGADKVFGMTSPQFNTAISKAAKGAGVQINIRDINLKETYAHGEMVNGKPISAGRGIQQIFRRKASVGKELTAEQRQIEMQLRGQVDEKSLKKYILETPREQRWISPEGKGVEVKRQVAKFQEKLAQTAREQKAQKEFFENIPAYKNLKISLEKDLGKYKGDTVLGRITGHMIEVLKGKARPDTIPHEISHYVVDVLKKFGSSKDKALLDKGIKMFGAKLKRKNYKSQKEFRKAQEEVLVQRIGEFAAGRMKNKTLMAKAKTFLKDFWVRIKDTLGITSKEDIAWIMSKRVVTGDVPTGKDVKNFIDNSKVHYQVDKKGNDSKKTIERKITANKIAHKFERELRDLGESKEALVGIRAMHGIPIKGSGWSPKNKNISLSSMETWANALEIKRQNTTQTKDKKSSVVEFAKSFNVGEKDLYHISKMIDIESGGDVGKLKGESKAILEHVIRTYGYKTEKIETTTSKIEELPSEKMPWVSKLARRAGLPVFYFLREHGGTPGKFISNQIIKFDVTFNHEFKGRGDADIATIKSLLGRKKSNNVWMFDLKRAKQARKDGENPKKINPKFTKAENEFYENMQEGAVIKGVENKINKKTGEVQGTSEYKSYVVYRELMDFYWNHLYKEVRKINNDVEFAKFEKEFSNKFVEEYFTRRVTPEFINNVLEPKNRDYLGEELKKTVSALASKKALKKYKAGSDKYNDYVKKLKDKKTDEGAKLEKEAIEELINITTHKHHKVQNKSLLERGPLFPEFIEVVTPSGRKKVIRTYETKLANTVEPYVMSMSKYLATLRHFPEFTGLGGKYKLKGETNIEAFSLRMRDRELGKYALDAIKELVGVRADEITAGQTFLQNFAHASAAMGLSSPTSGIKNMLIGIPRNFASYGTYNTTKGILSLFSANTWQEARRKGVLQFGAKTMELDQASVSWGGKEYFRGWMEKLFQGNLMTFTENVNRIVGMQAGKLYFQQQLGIMKGNKDLYNWIGTKKNAERLMRDMWKLSQEDIDFLMKSSFKSEKEFERLSNIIRQVEHYSHVSTQGGTSVGQLPLWASGRYAKPFTLFQRMAYSTTFDSVQNYVKPMLNGNVAPMARAIFAHSLSGGALFAMYKWLFDQESPVSSKGAFDEILYNLWRSEFAGLFGFVNEPYDRGFAEDVMRPVIVRNMQNTSNLFMQVYDKKRTVLQAINDWGKETVVLYGQADKMIKHQKSKQWTTARTWRERQRQYEKQFDIDNANASYEINYYNKDLKEALYFGSDKAKLNTFYAAYNAKMTDLNKIPGSTPYHLHKETLKAIKLSLKSMSPVGISAYTSKGRVVSKKAHFIKWVEDKYGKKAVRELKKAEADYQYLIRKFWRLVQKKEHWDKLSAYASQKNLIIR